MFDFSNYSTKSEYYDNSNRLVAGKMKDETVGVTIEEFVGLKPNPAKCGNHRHCGSRDIMVLVCVT